WLEQFEDRVVPTAYTVTTQTDFAIANANTDVNFTTGVITAGPGTGQVTLRSAVIASSHVGTTSNTISPPAGTYTITQGPADDEFNFNGSVEEKGDFDVGQNSLSITGAGAATTIIDGNNTDRIFDVQSAFGAFAPNGINFALSGVT